MRKYRGGNFMEFVYYMITMSALFIVYKILINIVSN